MEEISGTRSLDYAKSRRQMLDDQIRSRGIRSPRVLAAMQRIRRERFVPAELREFAYEDTALTVAAGRVIPQPYLVAIMVDALGLKGGERVLELGTGSAYTAAVIACIAGQVFSVQPIPALANDYREALAAEGVSNVEVGCGDDSMGWPEKAPFDAIIVGMGEKSMPETLRSQLKVGGCLVIPLGPDPSVKELVRITRLSETEYRTDDLADVSLVQLAGTEGPQRREIQATTPFGRWVLSDRCSQLSSRIAAMAEPFNGIDQMPLQNLLDRIGDSRIVLLGEASHGTSEFYLARDRITRALIEEKGFSFVAIEGDWPDAARVDHYVRHAEYPPSEWTAFARFPTWMWRNEEVRGFVDWLRDYNAPRGPGQRVAFHGLDLYSVYSSIRSILEYLDRVDPQTAQVARQRYGCLTPFQSDPSAYARAALTPGYQTCEKPVLAMLTELQARHRAYAEHDGERFLSAVQNARIVANAEEYYRTMFYGSRSAWNLRDTHMFETLTTLLAHHGDNSRAIVWAHNAHVGDSAATAMARRGEYNIARLCRARFGKDVYSVGFGTDTGTVAAASDWDSPMEIKRVRPALEGSYEWLCHKSGVARFCLPLRNSPDRWLISGLREQRLERAIGVVYRPETERQSHYFEASLPAQFDEYIWFDQGQAIKPLETTRIEGLPDTYPFGL